MAQDDNSSLENADAAAETLAAQMRQDPGADIRPDVDPLRGDELDKIFEETSPNEPVVDPLADAKRESGIKDEPAKEPAAEEPIAEPVKETPAEAPEKKSLLDDLLSKKDEPKTEDKPAPKDPYEEVKLRADASPKTRETFEALKTTAREREKAASDRAAKLEKELADLSAKHKQTEEKTLAPEVETELKELRAFRAQFDTENDPEFRSKFDKKLEANYDTVYGKLKEHGLKDEVLTQLKSLPTTERDAAIENFLGKLPPPSRRLIEAKLIENSSVLDQRRAELQEVRSKADQILAERAKAPVENVQKLETEIATQIAPVLKSLEWIHIREVPSTATPAEKTAIEKANEFAAFAQDRLKTAIVDHSPRARAEAALAVPLAYHFKAKMEAAAAQLAIVQKELDGIRRASQTSRTARTSAAPVVQTTQSKPAPASSEDALDELFKEAGGTL